ncbi:MAG TPA: Asd/ArgC dimerization domain-containing protein [Terriglobales bacterium]|jgi:aspartate-semialdehyde dehydrogenase|nr:Asd/ArgC dimerization domain-containing protein [Terriglobales bacterium]
MTASSKPGSSGASGAAAGGGLLRVAIVGAGTLKGKELKEVLDAGSFPALDVKLLDDDDALGQLDAVGDEATFIQSVLPEHLEHVDLAFFASEHEFTHKHWGTARKAGAAIVDLSYALEDEAGVPVRSPWIEQESGNGAAAPEARTVVTAHPAASVLALLLLRAQKAGAVQRAVATVFEPVSEHGRRGMDELHQQTVNLLSFQALPREVFDAQVAFNLLARYGEKSAPTLESVERRILGHLRRLTGERVPVPSVVLVQAPIFHGHVFSLYVETVEKVSLGGLAQSLEGEHISILHAPEDAPSNVSAAGQDQVLLALRADRVRENAFWLWATADNLRIIALTAVDCATELSRARGKVA